MAKSIDDTVLDAALNILKTNADRIVICATQPTTYSQASTLVSGGGKRLAVKSITSGTWTGPADGDASGRKVTKNQETAVSIEESGTADHIAIIDDGASALLWVTTCTSQAVTAGNTATINAYKDEIADPT